MICVTTAGTATATAGGAATGTGTATAAGCAVVKDRVKDSVAAAVSVGVGVAASAGPGLDIVGAVAAIAGAGDAERLATTRKLLSVAGSDGFAGAGVGAGESVSPFLRRDLLASRITRIGPAACRLARSIAAEAASAADSGLAVWAPADAAISSIAAAAALEHFHTSIPPGLFAACGRRSARRAPWVGGAGAGVWRF